MGPAALQARQQFVLVLYGRVVQVSNRFLHQCKTFHITVLALEDPSFEEIAAHTTQLAEIIRALADDSDPLIAHKATEYCELMTKIGVAIRNGDEVKLSALVEELARKPGL